MTRTCRHCHMAIENDQHFVRIDVDASDDSSDDASDDASDYNGRASRYYHLDCYLRHVHAVKCDSCAGPITAADDSVHLGGVDLHWRCWMMANAEARPAARPAPSPPPQADP